MSAWSAALAEAFASAPPGAVALHTLELYHPTWAGAVRIVQDDRDLVAALEAHAPVQAGQTVTFAACPFRFALPAVGDGPQTLSIRIDNVSRDLMPLLEAADLAHPVPVRITYRPYLASDLSGPQMDPPLTLDVRSVSVDQMSVTCTCAHADWLNRRFPRGVYTIERFPGIAPRV